MKKFHVFFFLLFFFNVPIGMKRETRSEKEGRGSKRKEVKKKEKKKRKKNDPMNFFLLRYFTLV